MTPDELIDNMIDKWHDGGGLGVTLPEYLRMTDAQYARWVMSKMPEEELAEWAKGWDV
jgi:hypothetical protein